MAILSSPRYANKPVPYKHLHSVHHRLHVSTLTARSTITPVEGFLLDTFGALLSEPVAGLSIRQAMFFFALSTCKTVDDHCGYNLPFGAIGIKSNFSQPWFVHWDVLLGTRMT